MCGFVRRMDTISLKVWFSLAILSRSVEIERYSTSKGFLTRGSFKISTCEILRPSEFSDHSRDAFNMINGVPKNGWFMLGNLIKMDDLGGL